MLQTLGLDPYSEKAVHSIANGYVKNRKVHIKLNKDIEIYKKRNDKLKATLSNHKEKIRGLSIARKDDTRLKNDMHETIQMHEKESDEYERRIFQLE